MTRQTPPVSLVALIAAAIATSSCAPSSELTRSRAKAIIESSKEFTEPVAAELFLGFDDTERGIKLGYWKEDRDVNSYEVLRLTASGQRLFTSSKGYLRAGGGERPEVITVAKTKRQLGAVTYINEAPDSASKGVLKIVEFLWFWNLEGLPKEVRDFAGVRPEPSFHNAIFKRHPDGWHVEAFDPEFRSAEASTAKARP